MKREPSPIDPIVERNLRDIRVSVAEEEVSYGEILYLQQHKEYIDPSDADLAQFVYDEEELEYER